MERIRWACMAGLIVALGCGGTAAHPDSGGMADLDAAGGEDQAAIADADAEVSPEVREDAAPDVPTLPDSPEDPGGPDVGDPGTVDAPRPDPGEPELPPLPDLPIDLDAVDAPEEITYLITDCRGLTGCFQECCAGQDPCPENCGDLCWNQASPEAHSAWNTYLDCIAGQCPSCTGSQRPPECDACEKQAQEGTCRTQTLACWDYGEWTCAQVVTCIGGCQDLEACQACVGKASLDAHAWLDPLGQCLVLQCPSGNSDSPVLPLNSCETDALSGACATPYQDCLAH